MTTVQVRNNGSFGFDTTALIGAGLTAQEATDTRTRVADATALASAIRQALDQARETAVSAFAPSDATLLVLPAGLSEDNRDLLFDTVIQRAFSGGPLNLHDWSLAVDALEHWAGIEASMLSPQGGGGSHLVRGTWYVNGQPWSLSELFTVNRVNTLAELDRMVVDSLNVIAANNEATKALTELMEKMFRKYYDNEWTDSSYSKVNAAWMDGVGTVDQDAPELAAVDPDRRPWTEGSEVFTAADGAPALERPVPFSQLLAWADKYIGPNSLIRAMASGVPASKDDFRATIDEVETIIGAFSSDNQVAQLRNETLFNSRSNLLEGLSSFLKGQQGTRSELARNT